MGAISRIGVLAVLLAGGGAGGLRAETPPETIPAACREATRGAADEIEALRGAEAREWRRALRAGRAGRRAMSRSLAAGPGAAPDVAARFEAANAEYFEALHAARTLCRCRLAREEAEPAECERKYPTR